MKATHRRSNTQSRRAAAQGGVASSQRAGDMALARSLPDHYLIIDGKIVFASSKSRQIRDRLRREA